MAEETVRITVTPRKADAAALAPRMIELSPVQERLKNTRHRLLCVETAEPEKTKSRAGGRPARQRATIYDYTNNRTLLVEGRPDRPESVVIEESGRQPLPSPDEFEEAVRIVEKDPEIGAALRENRLRIYRPMPPLVAAEDPYGQVERTIAVGLMPEGPEKKGHEIVGVNMIREAVVRFERGAPENSLATPSTCGLPDAGQNTTPRGTAGQYTVTIRQGATVLWRFLAIRPSASSGTNGSGIELRNVDYRGKRVLARAHVPILNVRYDNNACGPYRDWQWQEGRFEANGADVAPGFRRCPTPARTVLESGVDAGNFAGVAIYAQGAETILVSEMEAGWYRYISQWRFGNDGTIRPRFGFGAVNNSCVCNVHHHHVYWRLDFDIRTGANNRVREFNDPPLVAGQPSWRTLSFEARRYRDPARRRRWRVENTQTNEGYEIVPGAEDGTAQGDAFARGDLWVLRYRSSEIDDGVAATGPPYEAGLDGFVNGESVSSADVVVWYGGHFVHDIHAGSETGHILGPELRPVNW